MNTLDSDQKNRLINDPTLIHALKITLADSYALYLKSQNYHWNVEGPHFKPLHDLFQEHYTDLADAIDVIAELIRTLGEKAPGDFQSYASMTTLGHPKADADWRTMVSDLANDQIAIQRTLNQTLDAARQANDEVVIDVMTDRLARHQKNHWMLSVSLR